MTCERARRIRLAILASLTALLALSSLLSPTQALAGARESSKANALTTAQAATVPPFLPPLSYDSTGSVPISAAVADFNGDGDLDLVVINFCASSTCTPGAAVDVVLGHCDGTLPPTVSYG